MSSLPIPLEVAAPEDRFVADLTDLQRQAVLHDEGPLLILAGAGTGKTTVITRRIAWLIATQRAKPNEILALTFTDKAAAEMEERVDRLLPYGYTDVWLSTFHAFGDRLLREHALEAGLSPHVRVLSTQEQAVVLREHLFELPLEALRPLRDPTRYLQAMVGVIGRAKDEAVTPEEFLAYAAARERESQAHREDVRLRAQALRVKELAQGYAMYQELLQTRQAIDFGDQVLLAIRLFEQHPELLASYQQRFRYILVDEFQDTNWSQFRLLELLAPPTANVTVVADDDQSIYKWRGAAISNVLRFLKRYECVRRVVLTHNFRSSQTILDSAYRLIRHNDPDRLEVKEQIDKRLVAMIPREPVEPTLAVFDTVSSEADWVARQIQAQVEAERRAPGDFAILVRTNREADLFLRALNVCGIPWSFSGASGLFAKEEGKLLLSCLKTLADPEDSLSAYHVISSSLYDCPMDDLVRCLARARRSHRDLRRIFEEALADSQKQPASNEEADVPALQLGDAARQIIARFLEDVQRLVELSRDHSPGQLLYRWLSDTGWLKRHAALEHAQDLERLQVVARCFDQLRRVEELVGNRLPELLQSWDFFQALGEAAPNETEGVSSERVSVLTIHKAKGLEFPVVFMVGLVQGRFPTPLRRDPIELPDGLIKDILPAGDYHLQEERRLFYVGMTRAKEQLYLAASYDYGGRSARKVSQFVLEALGLSTSAPLAQTLSVGDRIERAKSSSSMVATVPAAPAEPLRLDPHGADDYLTCPLKYRYSHVLKIPIMRHHLVIYGAALHRALEWFFKRRLKDQSTTEEELLAIFEQAWSSEGFLSREHERQRLEQGRQTLRRFYAQQQRHPEQPSLIEEKFLVQVGGITVVGRWDRVDDGPDGAVLIDYKSSEVTEQKEADQRARASLQMAVYALAWRSIHGQRPHHVELRFVQTGLTGRASFSDDDLEKTADTLLKIAQGIRAGEFLATPHEMACRWCAYQAICPFAVG